MMKHLVETFRGTERKERKRSCAKKNRNDVALCDDALDDSVPMYDGMGWP